MNYQCPVCHEALNAGAGRTLCCGTGHSFDVAKQGYVNLLLAHQSRSRTPGDSRAMLAARSRLFSSKVYDFFAEAIAERIATEHVPGAQLLDVGCGEGYYLEHYLARVPGLSPNQLWGVDIAKEAAKLAAQRKTGAQLCVAASRALPFFPRSFHQIVSIFSPYDLAEIERVLTPGGMFHLAGPAPDHLQALKQIIYDRVAPHAANFDPVLGSERWQEITARTVRRTIQLLPPTITDLFGMTPYYWSATPAQQQSIQSRSELSETLAFEIRSYRFNG
ncbi:MAG: putative RNA methyltransferase [Pseudomonadales bacterium]